jgi:hypothetical protein
MLNPIRIHIDPSAVCASESPLRKSYEQAIYHVNWGST